MQDISQQSPPSEEGGEEEEPSWEELSEGPGDIVAVTVQQQENTNTNATSIAPARSSSPANDEHSSLSTLGLLLPSSNTNEDENDNENDNDNDNEDANKNETSNENENEKKETNEERQARIKAEAVAFALSDLKANDVRRGNGAPPLETVKATEGSASTPATSSSRKRKGGAGTTTGTGASTSTTAMVTVDDESFAVSEMQQQQQQQQQTQMMQLQSQSQSQLLTTTVQVQVPFEELLPGNKMIVDLQIPNQYQYQNPLNNNNNNSNNNNNTPKTIALEVVVPDHLTTPGTIIPVQIPLLNGYNLTTQNNEPSSVPKKKKKTKTKAKTKKNINKESAIVAATDKNWFIAYQKLIEYQKQFNSTIVPRSTTHRPKYAALGQWVYQQQMEQKKLSKEKKKLLNLIHFDWHTQSAAPKIPWMGMYAEMMEFLKAAAPDTKQFDGTDATKLCKENGASQRLITWVKGQRNRYRKKVHGLITNGRDMPESQITLLQAVQFDFDVENTQSRDYQWMEKYRQLIAFKDEYGTTRAPTSHPILGPWVTDLRGRRKQKLSQKRIELLNNIGFDWTKGRSDETVMNYNNPRYQSWQERKEFGAKP